MPFPKFLPFLLFILMPLPSVSALIAFETRIRALYDAGELPFLLHLCGGNEAQLLDIFRGVRAGDWIFSTHRNHYHYLCAGGSPERLEALIREGRSMFVFDAALNFLSSSVLAGTCAIAAGVAWQLQLAATTPYLRTGPLDPTYAEWPATYRIPWVWCFLGDGAEEEGHFYEAALFVEANALPCTFIIEDNQRQVDTPKDERRRLNTRTPASFEPLDHFQCVRRYYYTPTYPHAGTGAPDPVYQPAAVARHQARAHV